MPLIYRTMLPDQLGKPKIGSATGAPGLGVRVPPDPHPDIFPDKNGCVGPDRRGMSVAPSVDALPAWRIPRRLKSRFRNASGSNALVVFSMGEGQFIDSGVAERLKLCVTSATHGAVEPEMKMKVEEFQALLAGTQASWRKDE